MKRELLIELIGIRKYLGYTQDYIAKECEVSRETVSRFERGETHNLKLYIYYNETLRAAADAMRG